jgi:hypothetical protein
MKPLPLLLLALIWFCIFTRTRIVEVSTFHDGSRAYLVRCDGGGKA